MKQFYTFIVLTTLACSGLSCLCDDTEFSARLVKKSDLIFEGKVAAIDEVSSDVNGNNLVIKFFPVRILKGKIKDTVYLRSEKGSCGFIARFTERDQYLGIKYLVYSTKINGQYCYHPCNNRRISQRPLYPHSQYGPGQEDIEKGIKTYDSIYNAELSKLNKIFEK